MHMWDIVAAVTSTIVGMTILTGIVVRFLLLPYIRAQLIEPLVIQIGIVIQTANVISLAWDGHLEWSQKEVDRFDRSFKHVYRRLEKAGI